MSDQCWDSVVDGDPTLIRHCVNVLYCLASRPICPAMSVFTVSWSIVPVLSEMYTICHVIRGLKVSIRCRILIRYKTAM